MGFIYLDTETTSFNPGQICELSLIIEEPGTSVDAKNYFFEVDKMNSEAESVHGFSIDDLKKLSGGLRFKDYKEELLSLLSENVLVAHNLPFDEKFISSEFWRCGVSFKPAGRLDTMEYFKPILKIPAKNRRYGPYKNPKLSEVAEYYNIDLNKSKELCDKLFGRGETGYHDSKFDTTIMYIIVNLHREELHGGDTWHKKFTLGG